jgi:hypothetical protein
VLTIREIFNPQKFVLARKKEEGIHQKVFLHTGEHGSLCSSKKKLGQKWEGRRKAVKNGWVITLLIWAKN